MAQENVDVETTPTEEIATASGLPESKQKEEASTVLGKFKDVDALARAYGALEAEFTRRSQRLRDLEREMENLKPLSGEGSGAEKLRKTARARREEAKRFDAFVAEVSAPTDVAVEPIPSQEPAIATEQELLGVQTQERATEGEDVPRGEIFPKEGGQSTTTAFLQGDRKQASEPSVGESGGKATSSEELFQRASLNDEVRLRIVGEYLASLGKSGAPLTARGTGILATPPVRAKSLGEAGNMALTYLRKPNA